jgi:hypothetical protein
MEIPLQAQVECTNGICGRSVYVLINPVVDKIIANTIQLRCVKAELEKMEPFIETTFVKQQVGALPNFYMMQER